MKIVVLAEERNPGASVTSIPVEFFIKSYQKISQQEKH